jgi:hypothetical protein
MQIFFSGCEKTANGTHFAKEGAGKAPSLEQLAGYGQVSGPNAVAGEVNALVLG